jgi:hypothetical protein
LLLNRVRDAWTPGFFNPRSSAVTTWRRDLVSYTYLPNTAEVTRKDETLRNLAEMIFQLPQLVPEAAFSYVLSPDQNWQFRYIQSEHHAHHPD